MGEYLWCDHLGRRGGPGEGAAGVVDPPALPQSFPAQPGGGSATLRQGADSRAQSRSAQDADPRPLPGGRNRPQQGPGKTVPGLGDQQDDRRDPARIESMSVDVKEPKMSRADFATDQTVRWCPGCGDYAILAQVQKVMPALGVPRENIVFVS